MTQYFDFSTQGSTQDSASQVYWQLNQHVLLQWKGRDYRLEGMSPAFAFRRHEVLTLEGRDLSVAPIAEPPKRISLKAAIPNYQSILSIQPTRDGVLLNVHAPDYRHSDLPGQRVVRVNLDTPKRCRSGTPCLARARSGNDGSLCCQLEPGENAPGARRARPGVAPARLISLALS